MRRNQNIFAAPSGKRREPDMIPLINVVFLLLIFFLTAGSLVPERALKTDLPKAAADAAEGYEEGPEISIDSEGRVAIGSEIYVDMRKVTAAMLRLAAEYEGAPLPHINLRADADVPAALAAPLLETAERIGFQGVRLAVKTD